MLPRVGGDAQSAMGGHLTGDVPALLLIAVVLGLLMMNRGVAGHPRLAS
jgi:hypothetical protein